MPVCMAGPDNQTKIEETLAHHARALEELSEVMHRQQKEIAQLNRKVGLLMRRAAEAEVGEGGTVPLADQKPPHY